MEIILSIIAALGVMRFSFKSFFDDVSDLIESIKYWLTPDVTALFRGEWDREFWAEMRLFIWLLLGTLSGYGVYRFLLG